MKVNRWLMVSDTFEVQDRGDNVDALQEVPTPDPTSHPSDVLDRGNHGASASISSTPCPSDPSDVLDRGDHGASASISTPCPSDPSDVVDGRDYESLALVSSTTPSPWCKLISLNPQRQQHIIISHSIFTVSSDRTSSDLYLSDETNTVHIYRIKFNQSAAIELTGDGRSSVLVNGIPIEKNDIFPLKSGDEVTFSSDHSYILQLLEPTIERPPPLGFLDGKELKISFRNFPHSLSEITRDRLIGVSLLHSKVLITGPPGSEIYQEDLVKAIAKQFGAKLLIIGSRVFREGDKVQFVGQPCPHLMHRGPIDGLRGRVQLAFESKLGISFDKTIEGGNDLGGISDVNHGMFCKVNNVRHDILLEEELDSLSEVVCGLSRQESRFILLLKDVEKSTFGKVSTLKKTLESLPSNVLIIASHTEEKRLQNMDINISLNETKEWMQLFPSTVSISIPEDYSLLKPWKAKVDSEALLKKLVQEVETIRAEKNLNIFKSVLNSHELLYEGVETISIRDRILTKESVENVIVLALGHCHMQKLGMDDEELVISNKSIEHGIGLLHASQSRSDSYKNSDKNVTTASKYESMLLDNLISPGDFGVGFDDIGVEEEVKKTLKDFMILSLQRTELFSKGQLAKWSGDGESYVQAVFSLARKLVPCVIFVDEVDSMLSWKESSEEGTEMRNMKKEFIRCLTDLPPRVLILAATSRPFDLNTVVLGLFPYRVMIELPNAPNRKKILKVILAKQKNVSADVDLDAMAKLTHGYSATDLEKVCRTAAFHPMTETLQREQKYIARALGEGGLAPVFYGSHETRPILMDDFRFGVQQVPRSVPPKLVNEIEEWNELNGISGRKRRALDYYS